MNRLDRDGLGPRVRRRRARVLLDQRVELKSIDGLLLQERVDRRVEERPVLRERLLADGVGLIN